jgi:hypothetical protein
MSSLGVIITQAIVHHYGRDEFLQRLSHPFWFQSFGAVMGMDWHSSGITTSVIGALKRGLQPLSDELGIHVWGGPRRLRCPRLALVCDAVFHQMGGPCPSVRLVARVGRSRRHTHRNPGASIGLDGDSRVTELAETGEQGHVT